MHELHFGFLLLHLHHMYVHSYGLISKDADKFILGVACPHIDLSAEVDIFMHIHIQTHTLRKHTTQTNTRTQTHTHTTMYIYIYIYIYSPPPDRPSWGKGELVSVPRHDVPTDGRQSPSQTQFLSFKNFQNSSPPPFLPEFPKNRNFSPQC